MTNPRKRLRKKPLMKRAKRMLSVNVIAHVLAGQTISYIRALDGAGVDNDQYEMLVEYFKEHIKIK